MPEAEPITVTFQGDSSDLVSAANEGSRAMDNMGNSSMSLGRTLRSQTTDARMLFRAMIEMRVAMMSAEHVMKDFGMSTEQVNAIMGTANMVMDVAISLMAAYRAASMLKALASWLAAKAGFAEAAAEEAVATGGFGTPVAVMTGMGAIAAFTTVIALAQGGIVLPRSGGTLARLGEGGRPEAVIPLDRAGAIGNVTVNMNVYSNDPDMISRELGRRIQQLQNAGGF